MHLGRQAPCSTSRYQGAFSAAPVRASTMAAQAQSYYDNEPRYVPHPNQFKAGFLVTDFFAQHKNQRLKVTGNLPELGGWDPRKAPAMSICEDLSYKLELLLPTKSFAFKVAVHDLDSDGVRWESDGESSNRVVEVEPGTCGEFVNDSVCSPSPLEYQVEVHCPFGHSKTSLLLKLPSAQLEGAVNLMTWCAEDKASFMAEVQAQIEEGCLERPEWRGKCMSLAEAAVAEPSMVARFAKVVREARAARQRWASWEIARVHVPRDTSVAAVDRVVQASYLELKEAREMLQPPAHTIASWLEAQQAL